MDKKSIEKLDALTAHFRTDVYKQGHVLLHAESNPPGVYYLLEGQVKQYDITDSGQEIIVNIFKPFTFFPMTWALNNTYNQYFFEALTDIKIKTIPVADIKNLIASEPDVTLDLLKRLLTGVSGLQRRMAHLMAGEASSRVAYEIIIESKRFGALQKDGSTAIAVSQVELASRTGLSRETVNREIQKLTKAGQVHMTGKKLIVKDIRSLASELGSSL